MAMVEERRGKVFQGEVGLILSSLDGRGWRRWGRRQTKGVHRHPMRPTASDLYNVGDHVHSDYEYEKLAKDENTVGMEGTPSLRLQQSRVSQQWGSSWWAL
jgi:hypothetical protein